LIDGEFVALKNNKKSAGFILSPISHPDARVP
jgi:hypothetical protein